MIYLRSRKLSNNRYSVYLDYYYKGKRFTETLPITVRRDYFGKKKPNLHPEDREKINIANEKLLEKQLYLAKNGEIENAKKVKQKQQTLLDFCETVAAKKDHRTYNSTIFHLKNFGKNPFLNEIDAEFTTDFQEFLKSKNLSNTSVNVYMNRLRIMLNSAKEDGLLVENVPKMKIIKADGGRKIFLTIEELTVLNNTDCENQEVKQAFLFACFCGLRISDISALKWENIISVNGNHFIDFKQKKTKKETKLPLSEQSYAIISGKERNSMSVFLLPKYHMPNKILNKWAKKAGIQKHVTFHVARHTFASFFLNNGVSMNIIKDFMGHDSIKSTDIYTHTSDDTMRNALEKLPNLFKK